MLRHIAWFNEASVAPDQSGELISDNIGVCHRCLAPARAIEKLGVGCSVFGNLHDADPVHVSRHLQKLNADIVVIGAITGASRLRLARAAKHLGCYVVADFSSEEKDIVALTQLVQVADQIVASNAKIATSLEKQTGLQALVIPDSDEEGGKNTPEVVAELWLDCFHHLKLKPSAGANMNVPVKA